jgi:phosphonopyruvate decarboxylase
MKKYDFIVGIPCSKLKGIFAEIDNFIPCTREDEAVAFAVGVALMNKKTLVCIQNSGLGHIIDIMTSLMKPYGIEIDLLISLRTTPEHHAFMGKITKNMLKLLEYDKFTLVE